MRSQDGGAAVELEARVAGSLNSTSIFTSLAEASKFFARGAVGYSAACDAGCWDGLELHTDDWKIEPLEVFKVRSSFFDDQTRFPADTIEFDCALLMRDVKHEWRTLPRLQQTVEKL